MSVPSIDHSLLSPSGHMSKRARAAAIAREAARLFKGCGPLRGPAPAVPEAVRLRQNAARLRDLAARGMSPRKYAKEAARLEADADAIERGGLIP